MTIQGTEKVALVVTNDQHTNSTVAVCPPVVNLDDGGTYHATRTQRALWDCWRDFWQQANELTKGYRRVGVFNGDLGELDAKKRSTQLVTINKATILSMVIETLEPALDILDAAYFMRGTEAHTGKSAWLEEAVANDIDITIRESKAAASWWQYTGTAAPGVRFDIAHHATMGGLPWTCKNAANKLASLTMWYYRVDRDGKAPHVVIRSHNHTCADSFDNYPARAIFTGAWTTKTSHTRRIGLENAISDISGMVILCEGKDEYTVHKIPYEPMKDKKIWALKM